MTSRLVSKRQSIAAHFTPLLTRPLALARGLSSLSNNHLKITNAAHLASPFEAVTMKFFRDILRHICYFIFTEDLKSVRLASKEFESAATTVLFDQVYTSTSLSNMKIAKLIINRFKIYIRAVVFSSSYYRQLTEHDFKRGSAQQREITKAELPNDHYWSDGYKRYCRLRKEQQAVY